MSQYQFLTRHWDEDEPKPLALTCAICCDKYDWASVVNIDGHCICKECESEYKEIINYLNPKTNTL